jgi:hypothetical protein
MFNYDFTCGPARISLNIRGRPNCFEQKSCTIMKHSASITFSLFVVRFLRQVKSICINMFSDFYIQKSGIASRRRSRLRKADRQIIKILLWFQAALNQFCFVFLSYSAVLQ